MATVAGKRERLARIDGVAAQWTSCRCPTRRDDAAQLHSRGGSGMWADATAWQSAWGDAATAVLCRANGQGRGGQRLRWPEDARRHSVAGYGQAKAGPGRPRDVQVSRATRRPRNDRAQRAGRPCLQACMIFKARVKT